MSASTSPPIRSDVRRNRRAILDAARELFAAETDVPMYKIAQRAGVGQATIYRHFPDRSALAAAVAVETLDRYEQIVAAEGPTLEQLLAMIVDYVGHMGDMRMMIAEGEGAPMFEESRQRLMRLFDRPLREAQAEGRVSADLSRRDVLLLVQMIDGGINNAADTREQRVKLGERAVFLSLRALRP